MRRIKSPRDILALKVCDPAMGSGAFLVQACRYLADRLVESWDLLVSENPGVPLTMPFGTPLNGGMREMLIPEDHEQAVVWARRFIAEHCIYGVDLNPLAVELAKMSLWLITLSKDKPFEFFDHKLKHGNSLIGCRTEDLDRYPVAAWDRKGAEGPIKEALKQIKKDAKIQAATQEKDRKRGQTTMLSVDVAALRKETAAEMREIDDISTFDPQQKERLYRQNIEQDERYQGLKRMFDTWCALWFWPLEGGEVSSDLPLAFAYGDLLNHFAGRAPVTELATEERLECWSATVTRLWGQERFFHWELEFPDAFERGGFDCVVGNPPWEQLKVNEREWFAGSYPDIAGEDSAPTRSRRIEGLANHDPAVYAQWRMALRRAELTGAFAAGSSHYPLTGRGDINTYPLFTELGLALLAEGGRAGMVLKTGLLVNETWCDFVRDLLREGRLRYAFDFVNTKEVFRGLAPPERFALVGLVADGSPDEPVDLAFLCTGQHDLEDPERVYALTAEEILAVNPNTGNLPQFLSAQDASLTARLYRERPVLYHQGSGRSPWCIRYHRMFDMKNDAQLFADNTLEPLLEAGWLLHPDGIFRLGGERMLPLYEAKLFQCYDHRSNTFATVPRTSRFLRKAAPRPVEAEEKGDPTVGTQARYWVAEGDFRKKTASLGWDREWLFAFHDISQAVSNQKVANGTLLPWLPMSNAAPVLLFDTETPAATAVLFAAVFCSLPFDYVVRQKLAGAHLNLFILEQVAAPAPEHFEREFTIDGVARSAADLAMEWAPELVCVTDSLMPLGRELGLAEPYAWNEERRFHLRRALDALMAHLYGMTADEFDHALSAFRIINENDMRDYQRLRTWETCLDYYECLQRGELPEPLRKPR